MADSQTTLFPTSTLTADASIQAALGAFDLYLEQEGKALNTRKAFVSDVRLLGKYLGIGQPIGEIGTKNLNDFLNWLVYERGVPCSRKSYARRVTTLKVLFGWLYESGVLSSNPAAAVIQISVISPLPTIPTSIELRKALDFTATLREGFKGQKPDARPDLLLNLLLQTGIKKSEAMAIVPNHVDRRDPQSPILYVRYKNPRYRYKERKIDLDPNWLDTLDKYLEQYKPTDTLFTCTARNLEYVLSDVAESAGLPGGLLFFENLRWSSAMQDYLDGVEPDEIRQKLGLSKITWRETKSKLDKMAPQYTGN
jgi:integrase/recombinase XerD